MVQDLNGSSILLQEDVKILLLGEPGVGKTSLIFSLVNDEFDSEVPARLIDIIIPPGVTSENVQTHIVDYSAREQTEKELEDSIHDANVICLVYDASSASGLTDAITKWIPRIRQVNQANESYKPIVLVANKIDLIEAQPLDEVNQVIQTNKDIELFIEVSASLQKNIVELFFAAQKTLLYPLSPLYDPVKRTLTKKCRDALTDIFKRCDLDCDDRLNDDELNTFQEANFGAPLEKDSLDEIKNIIKQSTADGIINNSVTLSGFLLIHLLSINKGQHQFTWQVLRNYNYDRELNLRDSDSNEDNNTIVFTPETDYCCSSNVEDHDDDDYSGDKQEDFWILEAKVGAGLAIAAILGMIIIKYYLINKLH